MIRIKIQSTPNPNARKYLLNIDIKNSGKVSYTSSEECEHVPLAHSLLVIPGISQVHFFENVLTVSQNGDWDWADLDEKVQDLLYQYLSGHDPAFEENPQKNLVSNKNLPPELQIVDEILERSIRPSLQADGGDVEVIDLHENILTVRYMGACGGCPSSMYGTLEAIRRILKDEYRNDLEVIAI